MPQNRKGSSTFGTVLVPLDGSTLAERALPIAKQLALATGSNLLLARISPILTWTTTLSAEGAPIVPEIYQQLLDDEERLAQEYLARQAETLHSQDIVVRTFFTYGHPASCLLDLEDQEHVGLVVMTTHGRTGLARFALGSVADRLVRGGQIPVLLLRSFGKTCSVDEMHRALVPLDGSTRAEQAMTSAQQLAGHVLREIVLLRVVDADATPADMSEAERYLEEVAVRERPTLATHDCQVTTLVLKGDAAEQIVQRAEADCQLVIMATHGRTGVARWALGSVADRVLQAGATPLLLVRAI